MGTNRTFFRKEKLLLDQIISGLKAKNIVQNLERVASFSSGLISYRGRFKDRLFHINFFGSHERSQVGGQDSKSINFLLSGMLDIKMIKQSIQEYFENIDKGFSGEDDFIQQFNNLPSDVRKSFGAIGEACRALDFDDSNLGIDVQIPMEWGIFILQIKTMEDSESVAMEHFSKFPKVPLLFFHKNLSKKEFQKKMKIMIADQSRGYIGTYSFYKKAS